MRGYNKGFRDGIQAFEDLLNEKSIIMIALPSDVKLVHEFILAHGAVVREPTELAMEVQRDVKLAFVLYEAVSSVFSKGLVYQRKSKAKRNEEQHAN